MISNLFTSYLDDSQRLLWPNEALCALDLCDINNHIQRAVLLSRIPQRRDEGETELLAAWSIKNNHKTVSHILLLELLARHRLRHNNFENCESLLTAAEHLSAELSDYHKLPLQRLRYLLTLNESSNLPNFPGELGGLLALQLLITRNNQSEIELYLEQWPRDWSSPESFMLKASALRKLGKSEEAAATLARLLEHHPGFAQNWQNIIELNHKANRNNGLAVSMACQRHPNHPGLLIHRVAMELYARHGAKARRLAMKARILQSIGKTLPSPEQNDSNFVAAFDYCGSTHLLSCIHPTLKKRLPNIPSLHANLICQLASLAVPEYKQQALGLASVMPAEDLPKPTTRGSDQPLKVGLISPDLGYHPVGRFVQMLLQGGFGAKGKIYLINTCKDILEETKRLAGPNYINLADQTKETKLQTIRSLNLDVAIDLAGWTGENNGWLFARRLAPLQVNFLGYFASSGLGSVDLWIGDAGVFPEPMQEWHSEKVVRLSRPFLAWSPTDHLAEGTVAVPSAPQGPITFGCFNHVRKLSPATLRCWGKILNDLPSARLALKSFASDDPGVRQIIERQMQRHGLDPKRVFWLATTVKPSDHLRQYGLIDVALDPFPNGGCTTTCEALWMGVPVIALEGTHYVSRMGSAVLHGAGLENWVCRNEKAYINRAQQAAEDLQSIRNNRQALRQLVINSPLGNNKDWAKQLWDCLEKEAQHSGTIQ